MVGFGAVMLVYSVIRFEHITTLLDDDKFAAARWGPIVLAALGLAVALGSLIVLIV